MTGWETVEHWQVTSPDTGWVYQVWLKRIEDMWAKAWRVEWGRQGHARKYASFSGPDREPNARKELAHRIAAYKGGGEWKKTG